MSRNRRVARSLPASPRSVVTARSPGDLVAAIPYLVGFTPSRSLVVISLRGARLRFGLVARVDLPDEGVEQAAARSLCGFVMRDRPREAVVVVYDERPWDPTLRPWQSLVDALGAELAGHHVSVREAMYVTPQRFWSFTCTRNSCCPDDGWPLSEATASPVAVAYVLNGCSPFADRPTLAARLAPSGPLTTAAVDYATEAALDAVAPWWQAAGESRWIAWQRECVAHFDALTRRYVEGGITVSPDEAGRLLAGLTDVGVRDVVGCRWTRWWQSLPHPPAGSSDPLEALVQALTDDAPAPDVADLEVREAVGRLLLDLAVRTEGTGALAPLTLLAMHAWSSGQGAHAGVALDRALAIDRRYQLALLVDALLRSGLEPSWVGADRAEDESAPPRRPRDVPLTG